MMLVKMALLSVILCLVAVAGVLAGYSVGVSNTKASICASFDGTKGHPCR